MPRLFIPNAEEALPYADASFRDFFEAKTLKMFPRFLGSLKTGDILLSPLTIETAFADYICRLLNLGRPSEVIINFELASSYLVGESISQDAQARQEIARRCSNSTRYELEPYMQTEAVHCLGRELALPVRGTSSELVNQGLIEAINDKSFCKGLGLGCQCRVVSGLQADSLPDLKRSIAQLSRHLSTDQHDLIMLRKVKYAGGAGNLVGTAEELQQKVSTWYNVGRVLVEPFMPFARICGSLSVLEESGPHFIGLDSQVFNEDGWCGFDYPAHFELKKQAVLSKLEGVTKRLEHALFQAGARGLLNIDWGLVQEEDGLLEPVLLECNFRHNGFSYVVDIAKKLFGSRWRDMYIRSREAVPTSCANAQAVLQALAPLTFEGEPILLRQAGSERGLVVTSPPAHGGAALAVFGDTTEYADSILEMAKRALNRSY
ncbi:MAG: hypothetical protein K6A35_01260 [bacterium]|nr:hypothetical protein [bacterium]